MNLFSLREKYFDGKKIITKFRNPWKINITINGTDAMSFQPNPPSDLKLWGFLDDFSKTGALYHNCSRNYFGVNTYRYLYYFIYS